MKVIKSVLAAALFLTASVVMAGGEGSGARGGGHIVEVNGSKELYDLVAKSTCDWKTGKWMINHFAVYESILAKIESLDWYFANELRRETEYLNYCFTGPLYLLKPKHVDEEGKVTTPILPDKQASLLEQGAIRLDSVVYWDHKKIESLSARSQALLLIHEVMHSYLSMNQPEQQRYDRLWSMVQAISRVESGEIADTESLHYQMQMNQVLFPTLVRRLDSVQTQIEFLVASPSKKKEMVLASESPESLIDYELTNDELQALSDIDQGAYLKSSKLEMLRNTLRSLLVSASVEQFDQIVNRKSYTEINISLVALSLGKMLTGDKAEILFKAPSFNSTFAEFYERFSKLTIIENELGRLMVDGHAFSLIDPTLPDAVMPFTSVIPMDLKRNGNASLSVDVQGFTALISQMARLGYWTEIKTHVTANESFYSAFSLDKLLEQVQSKTGYSVLEREVAVKLVGEMSQGLVQLTLRSLKTQMRAKDYSKFESELMFDKKGLRK